MEPTNHPIEKGHHLPFTSVFGFPPLVFPGVQYWFHWLVNRKSKAWMLFIAGQADIWVKQTNSAIATF